MLISEFTNGIASSANADVTVLSPLVSGLGLDPTTSLSITLSVTASVNFIVPSNRGSRSSSNSSCRISNPNAKPILPAGSSRNAPSESLKSINVIEVSPFLYTGTMKLSIVAWFWAVLTVLGA